jgi:putative ABC transport system permease protein
MISPRWRIVLRSLSRDRLRTLLAVLAMAVSVMSIGMVSGASVILVGTLDSAYRHNHPADAVLEASLFDNGVLSAVRQVPGVSAAEPRRVLHARLLRGGDDRRNLDLIAVPDFGTVELNRVFPEAGAWPPPFQGVILERSTLAFIGGHLDDRVLVEMPGGRRDSLPVEGTAHDLNYPSAVASGLLHGYISMQTLLWLGQGADFNELLLASSGARTAASIASLVDTVRATAEAHGAVVLASVIPTPGRFWADDQIDATVLLLDTLALLAFLMSGFLVANIVSALIAREVRVIGVMKAVGAQPLQVGTIYLGLVLVYGLLALAVGVPAGAVGAVGIVESTRAVLNFDPPGFVFSPAVLGLQVATAVLVAIVAALRPVLRASRITVREAISSEGSSAGRGAGRLGRRLSTPMRVSVRNAFRRRGRLALTLAALLLGGLAFTAVLSVRNSLDRTLNDAAASRGYDVQLRLSAPHSRAEVERLAAQPPGVASVETWAMAAPSRVRPDGSTSPTLQLIAPPASSHLVRPPLLSGRWLQPGDEHAVVVNSDAVHAEPDLTPGSELVLRFARQDTTWRVVGVVRGLLAGPILYADRDQVETVLRSGGFVDNLEVVATDHSVAGEARLARAEEEAFKNVGFAVDGVDTTTQWRDFLAADYSIATNFLLAMAVLLAVVGGLTLMGTMSINVIERTREIGVMRAIGASDGAIRRLVISEGLVIAAAGWLLAAPLSPLAGLALSNAFGQAFLHVPLVYEFSWPALGLWLLLVLAVAAVSSLLPAWNASRLTVRQVLAYA